MTIELKQAQRKQVKLRVGVSGPAGSGKTYSSLLLARGMASAWNKIAVIDTENGSGELYSHLGDYKTIDLKEPFTPERYIEAIRVCEKAGMEVIILDSASHEWDGPGGCLSIVDSLGGAYTSWGKVTPRHNAFIQAILKANMHVITATRRKQDYEMTKDNNGKVKVEKMGLKEVQRDGFEYELTLAFEIDTRHNAKASKDRTGLFMDKPEFVISEETGKQILAWNQGGVVDQTAQKLEIARQMKRIGLYSQDLKTLETHIIQVTNLALKPENFANIIEVLKTKDEIGVASDEFLGPDEPQALAEVPTHTPENDQKTDQGETKGPEMISRTKLDILRALGRTKAKIYNDQELLQFIRFVLGYEEILSLNDMTMETAGAIIGVLTVYQATAADITN